MAWSRSSYNKFSTADPALGTHVGQIVPAHSLGGSFSALDSSATPPPPSAPRGHNCSHGRGDHCSGRSSHGPKRLAVSRSLFRHSGNREVDPPAGGGWHSSSRWASDACSAGGQNAAPTPLSRSCGSSAGTACSPFSWPLIAGHRTLCPPAGCLWRAHKKSWRDPAEEDRASCVICRPHAAINFSNPCRATWQATGRR